MKSIGNRMGNKMGNRICIRCKFSFRGTKKDNLCPDCQRELLEEIRKEKLKKTFKKIDEKIVVILPHK